VGQPAMKVAIIGCGVIGHKRAKGLGDSKLVACADLVQERAESLARQFSGCVASTDWRAIVSGSDIDIVIVATTNDSLAEVTSAAASHKKHILVEKPGARNRAELARVAAMAASTGALIRIGFNHRYHRALQKARRLIDEGSLGDLMFLRARYGHGGRIGYDKEWRGRPEVSGGGELLDQGVHLIDLARWFLGDFETVQGYAHTYYWSMPVDDNAFLLLRTTKHQVAFLHVSCTEWKNLFSLEIYGTRGKLHVEGLGGSYGVERLSFYRMLPEMGPPETTIWEYPMADDSWLAEFQDFVEDITLGRQPACTLEDASAVLAIVDQVYKESGYDHRA
jgi:predicted dehydrogenase